MKNCYYDKLTHSLEDRKGLGNDVKKSGLIKRFTSPILWQNSRLHIFMLYIDTMLINLTETIKTAQFLNNFTITKHDKRYNL